MYKQNRKGSGIVNWQLSQVRALNSFSVCLMFFPSGTERLLILQHHFIAWECPKGDKGICPHRSLNQEDTLPRNTPTPAAPSRFLWDQNPNTCLLQSNFWQRGLVWPTHGAPIGLGQRDSALLTPRNCVLPTGLYHSQTRESQKTKPRTATLTGTRLPCTGSSEFRFAKYGHRRLV